MCVCVVGGWVGGQSSTTIPKSLIWQTLSVCNVLIQPSFSVAVRFHYATCSGICCNSTLGKELKNCSVLRVTHFQTQRKWAVSFCLEDTENPIIKPFDVCFSFQKSRGKNRLMRI